MRNGHFFVDFFKKGGILYMEIGKFYTICQTSPYRENGKTGCERKRYHGQGG